MTREWVDAEKPRDQIRDKRWVMRCDVERPDGSRCPTQGRPHTMQPPLSDYARDGWFIADFHGDVCPSCLAKGYQPMSRPHEVMSETAERG